MLLYDLKMSYREGVHQNIDIWVKIISLSKSRVFWWGLPQKNQMQFRIAMLPCIRFRQLSGLIMLGLYFWLIRLSDIFRTTLDYGSCSFEHQWHRFANSTALLCLFLNKQWSCIVLVYFCKKSFLKFYSVFFCISPFSFVYFSHHHSFSHYIHWYIHAWDREI